MTLISCIVLPPNPRMVTEYVPAGAIENVLKVSVLLPEAGFGLMVVKTPGGGFKTNRKTALLKPPSGVIVIVLVAAEPCATDTLLGEAESKKSGEDETGALTVRLICVLCVKPHEQVAVTVTVNVPVDAEELAASVRVLEVAVALGLKEAVTPFGRPEAERVGLQANPFCGVIEIVLVPLEPCVIARLLGDAEIEKLAELEGPVHGDVPALTVRLIVVVCVKLPAVPVTVTVAVPVAALEVAVSVKVVELVAGFGLNEAVTPLGKPEPDRDTLPLKPFAGVMVIVLLPLDPCAMVRLFGDADKEKSG